MGNRLPPLGFILVLLMLGGCGRPAQQRGAGESAPDSSPSPAAVHDTTAAEDSTSATRAVAWIHDYYAAINDHRYREAYVHWARGGQASGKSLEEFEKGFTQTEHVEVVTGTPGPIEGAAGSRYVEVPVRIEARTRSGAQQSFVGTYTLRLSVVDGATPEQRSWHFETADVRPAAP